MKMNRELAAAIVTTAEEMFTFVSWLYYDLGWNMDKARSTNRPYMHYRNMYEYKEI